MGVNAEGRVNLRPVEREPYARRLGKLEPVVETATGVPSAVLVRTFEAAPRHGSIGQISKSDRAKTRGWLVRRALLSADMLGLTIAFALSVSVFGTGGAPVDRFNGLAEVFIFLATLPVWIIAAKLHGLYDRDGERADHSTADDFFGVFVVVTIGTWIVFMTSWVTGLAAPNPPRAAAFWGLSIVLVTLLRVCARVLSRKSVLYLQNTVIVGAGEIGQLIARKLLKHPEYGINLVGFVDNDPKERREDLGYLTILGTPEELPEIVELLDVERVVVAFSRETHEEMLTLIRRLRELDLQVDIVPRLFEIVGPGVDVHSLEGMTLVGLPPARLSRSSRLLKRAADIVGASLALVLTAPLFAFIAWRIKRDSPGPIFFRQTRLSANMRPFTAFKFRTMHVGTCNSLHRDYIKSTMSSRAPLGANGLYKLDRTDATTEFGRWLRRSSLDELPQLLNVLRGEMSLVGPRPCIEYETEFFEPHHFERFLVPAGLTGLWQVTARANSTFGEALDMDVAYARGWSLGLDMRLLLRTPLALIRQRGTA